MPPLPPPQLGGVTIVVAAAAAAASTAARKAVEDTSSRNSASVNPTNSPLSRKLRGMRGIKSPSVRNGPASIPARAALVHEGAVLFVEVLNGLKTAVAVDTPPPLLLPVLLLLPLVLLTSDEDKEGDENAAAALPATTNTDPRAAMRHSALSITASSFP